MPDKKKDKKTYKEIHGTTRVGDFLRGIKDVAPDILDIAGDVTGIDGLNRLGEKIKGADSISEADKAIALKELELDMMEAELEMVREQETTKRWQADMHSDSKLSKNIRPITLAVLIVSVITLSIVDAANPNFDMPDSWVSLLGNLAWSALGGYFVLRQVGKYTDKKYKK